MAAVCEVCGKRPSFGMSISHSHRRTKRRWNPNIQRIRVLVDGTPRRIDMCTGCIKAGKVVKASRGRQTEMDSPRNSAFFLAGPRSGAPTSASSMRV